MSNANIIAKRLLDLRGEQKRDIVAKEVGISYSALSMYETGQRIPRDEIKVAIAQYYQKSVEEIFFAT